MISSVLASTTFALRLAVMLTWLFHCSLVGAVDRVLRRRRPSSAHRRSTSCRCASCRSTSACRRCFSSSRPLPARPRSPWPPCRSRWPDQVPDLVVDDEGADCDVERVDVLQLSDRERDLLVTRAPAVAGTDHRHRSIGPPTTNDASGLPMNRLRPSMSQRVARIFHRA